jgi:hypothetical protein
MSESERELAMRMLSHAGVSASETDLARIGAIRAVPAPRPSPRLDTEPQLVQTTTPWTAQ